MLPETTVVFTLGDIKNICMPYMLLVSNSYSTGILRVNVKILAVAVIFLRSFVGMYVCNLITGRKNYTYMRSPVSAVSISAVPGLVRFTNRTK